MLVEQRRTISIDAPVPFPTSPSIMDQGSSMSGVVMIDDAVVLGNHGSFRCRFDEHASADQAGAQRDGDLVEHRHCRDHRLDRSGRGHDIKRGVIVGGTV